MVIKRKTGHLYVLMNGHLVGHLERVNAGSLSFRYDDTWLDTPGARPISLSLPLVSTVIKGDVVYHYFDNLLPDNPQIRARIQARFQTPTDQPFDLLSSIGQDCIGAVQLTDTPSVNVHCIDALPVSDADVAAKLSNFASAPLGMSEDQDDFRISIAGAQEKSAYLLHHGQWCIPQGATPTSHIFKLPIGQIAHQHMDLSDSCENEWLCAQILQAFGLPVAQCEVRYFDGTKVLVVERFDRRYISEGHWIARLPQEDCCQALGVSPNLKYQSDGGPGIVDIMKLLQHSAEPNRDQAHFFTAQVVFWLLAAIDGHAKNFSIFLEAFGRYRLTPLYDVMSAHPLLASKQLERQKIKMAMALQGKNRHYRWHVIDQRHFISTAKAAQFSTLSAQKLLDDTLAQVETVIGTVSQIVPSDFPARVVEPIFEGMKQMRDKLVNNRS